MDVPANFLIGSRLFLWWVFNEIDQTEFDGIQVKIVAEDQSIFLKYGLEQSDGDRYLVLSFNRDLGRVHVKCPKFESDDGIISSSGIRKLIAWSSDIKNIEIVHSWSAQSGIMKGDLAKKIYEGIRSNLQKT
ncbi:MAG: hypothetical protein ACRBHB_06715 [Arenicella sp.]